MLVLLPNDNKSILSGQILQIMSEYFIARKTWEGQFPGFSNYQVLRSDLQVPYSGSTPEMFSLPKGLHMSQHMFQEISTGPPCRGSGNFNSQLSKQVLKPTNLYKSRHTTYHFINREPAYPNHDKDQQSGHTKYPSD